MLPATTRAIGSQNQSPGADVERFTGAPPVAGSLTQACHQRASSTTNVGDGARCARVLGAQWRGPPSLRKEVRFPGSRPSTENPCASGFGAGGRARSSADAGPGDGVEAGCEKGLGARSGPRKFSFSLWRTGAPATARRNLSRPPPRRLRCCQPPAFGPESCSSDARMSKVLSLLRSHRRWLLLLAPLALAWTVFVAVAFWRSTLTRSGADAAGARPGGAVRRRAAGSSRIRRTNGSASGRSGSSPSASSRRRWRSRTAASGSIPASIRSPSRAP